MSSACQHCQPNQNIDCQKQQQKEDCFMRIANNAANKTNDATLRTNLTQHQKDLKATRRAEAATAVYSIDTQGKLANPPACLKLIDTSSEASMRRLESDLGLPKNSLRPSDFSNEKNGYRAAVFYDQRDEKYVVSFRGTNKNNLIDWQNNINNQLPDATESDAPSYFAAKNLGGLLKDSKPPVEFAGHSKGGGEVYEALSNAPNSIATVFNPAGPSPRISEAAKQNIASRTQNYQVGGEMLNLMQNETDPKKTVENMKWLKGQVDSGLWGTAKAVKITERDNLELLEKQELEKKTGRFFNTTKEEKEAQAQLEKIKEAYEKDRKAFINKLDTQITEKENWLKDKQAGKPVPEWTPPFAKSLGDPRILGGDPDRDSPGIGGLLDHTMDNMNAALKDQIKTDRKALETQVRKLEPNFDKKLNDCSAGI